MGKGGHLAIARHIYATPLLVIVCLGVNDVLFGHNVNDITQSFLVARIYYF